MAEGSGQDRDREDLSEEASPYRLEEYRKKGRVAQSRELSGMLVLLATGVTLYVMSPTIGAHIVEFMRYAFRADTAASLNFGDKNAMTPLFFRAVKLVALLGLPIAAVGFIMGVLGSFSQIGAVFSTEPLNPDLSKIDPIKGLQRYFSMKMVYDGLRLIFRAAVVVGIAFVLVKAEVVSSPSSLLRDPGSLLNAFGETGRLLFMALCLALVFFAGFDFWIQKWEFGKSVRLTKQEQKEEHKEREGDPLIKARIRSVQREMARRRMLQAVKKADVVVTNPTHFAIALAYDREKMGAPKVVAKGKDFLAQRIKKIAGDAGVPMVENKPLARTLYKTVKVGQSIPRSLYQAVAEVLAYVYRLKAKRFQ